MTMLPQALLLVTLLSIGAALASNTIKSLPGFPGDLPFKLETGYVGVGELDEVQLFYYFIESERSPVSDPLVLWLTGGPGCSGLSGLLYEIGPLSFDYSDSTGNKPKLTLNPYSWTKVANIIFVDAPVGTGFSFSKTWQGYNMTDSLSAEETYEFLRKWLMDHPKFLSNPLYVAGDSYSGIVAPIIVQKISDGNRDKHVPPMNFHGYVLGNPLTNSINDGNWQVVFAHREALISDELYQSLKRNCNGDYVNVDPNNTLCVDDLQLYNECVDGVHLSQILEPTCLLSLKKKASKWTATDISKEDSLNLLLSSTQLFTPWCRNYNYVYSNTWANDKTVQDALHVREGSIKEWARCNDTLRDSVSYTSDVTSSLVYHENLIKQGYRVLIYSGDHDLRIPYVGTIAWIESLNLTVGSPWNPWFVNGQVAGYRVMYNKYQLTFTTIKGGGHTAPEYKPEECLAMISRWFAYYPL